MAIPKPTSRTQPPGSTKHRKAALAGGGRHGSGAQLPVTCLKDNQPAGLCGWTEQINTVVRALDSCQSEWLAWEATDKHSSCLGPGPRDPWTLSPCPHCCLCYGPYLWG